MKLAILTRSRMASLPSAALMAALLLPLSAGAQEAGQASDLTVVEADSLDELLKNVEERRVVESREHNEREARFRAAREDQQQMLRDAQAERRREEQRSERLETQFEENEIRIGNLQEQLDKRLGSLRELFGVLQQVAGDTRGLFEASLISAEIPNRGEWLGELAAKMGKSTQLASIDEMEELWENLQREMTESGRISRFTSTVNMLDGEQVQTDLIRVGSFAIVSEDGYINYDTDIGALVELGRQPEAQFANTATDLFDADGGDLVAFAIDPTRGSLISLLIQKATLAEMVGTPFGGFTTGACYLPFCDGQGDYPGSVIIMVGIIGVLLAIERLVTLTLVGRKVSSQYRQPENPTDDNPLGRVLKVYDDNRDVDVETLDLKLGEAILSETPALTRNITIIQVISVVAPLMGLLGTVIGMIETFQSITLFGTGDPKTMASGISTALMTTVLGLCVAIPTVLLHAIVNQRSRGIIHVLEEQSQGIVAKHAEESGQPLG
ncbi:MAG: MotA/TolQ/ExbB proton channel family protein [Gammaproteobacteria bacterium]|nr:MotA/TolQ/ExbB proton channel family protein [Gammaproteobacteria bacterium]MYB38535.1 MotA/TolQ/ExbB proton channel family protein [Gammaproteobacteria bacterium]